MVMAAGKHDFDGNCAPSADGVLTYTAQETFSVGIFEWVPTSSGKGCKRGAVKVRVKGPFSDPEKVYSKARAIAGELDAGTYAGPKNVTVAA